MECLVNLWNRVLYVVVRTLSKVKSGIVFTNVRRAINGLSGSIVDGKRLNKRVMLVTYNFWKDTRKELNIKPCPNCGWKMGGRLIDGRWLYFCEHCVNCESPTEKDFTNSQTSKSIRFKRYKIKKMGNK